VTWKEIEHGIKMEDFRIDNMARRIARVGDLFAPLLKRSGRADLYKLVGSDFK